LRLTIGNEFPGVPEREKTSGGSIIYQSHIRDPVASSPDEFLARVGIARE
jgi:hypothetical protein